MTLARRPLERTQSKRNLNLKCVKFNIFDMWDVELSELVKA